MGEGEEGAPELLGRSAVFAEASAGGKVEHPDADDGKEDEARDPDVSCDPAAMNAGEEKAADHWDEKSEDGAEQLRVGGVGVRVVQGYHADSNCEQDDGNEGMGEEPDGLTGEIAHGFIVRDVSSTGHDVSSQEYSTWLKGKRCSVTAFVACAS